MPDRHHPLDGVLTDSRVARAITVSAAYVMKVCNVAHDEARQQVLSAISDPKKLAALHDALHKNAGQGLISWMVRCRVIELLRAEGWKPGRCSLPNSDDEVGADSGFSSREDDDARVQLLRHELVTLVRNAVARFAEQGPKQRAQIKLLRRYISDDISYDELCCELKCTNNTVRGRVFKAKRALRRFFERYNLELSYRE